MKYKLLADTDLHARRALRFTIVRPGGLTDEPGSGVQAGKVQLGKIRWVWRWTAAWGVRVETRGGEAYERSHRSCARIRGCDTGKRQTGLAGSTAPSDEASSPRSELGNRWPTFDERSIDLLKCRKSFPER